MLWFSVSGEGGGIRRLLGDWREVNEVNCLNVLCRVWNVVFFVVFVWEGSLGDVFGWFFGVFGYFNLRGCVIYYVRIVCVVVYVYCVVVGKYGFEGFWLLEEI